MPGESLFLLFEPASSYLVITMKQELKSLMMDDQGTKLEESNV
jgi:hypothetical protein